MIATALYLRARKSNHGGSEWALVTRSGPLVRTHVLKCDALAPKADALTVAQAAYPTVDFTALNGVGA